MVSNYSSRLFTTCICLKLCCLSYFSNLKQDNQKEAEEEPSSKEMYEEVADHPSHLIDVMHKALEKIPKRGDIDINTLKYFDVK